VKEFKVHGGKGVQLLRLGINGHVGFNEPSCGPDSLYRVVSFSESTRKQNGYSFGGDPSLVPSSAITLGLKEILYADEIHLIVTGTDKANVLYSLINEPTSEYLCLRVG